jgi:hypothetical protein
LSIKILSPLNVSDLAIANQKPRTAGGVMMSSLDGTNWFRHDIGPFPDIYGITAARGSFVAVGDLGTMIQSSDLRPRLVENRIDLWPDGTVHLEVEFWRAGAQITLEASQNLQDWAPLDTRTNLSGSVAFGDLHAGTVSARFYRALVPR